MTGLDTNILVRHYTQDDPVQCELAWVLRKAYKYSKQQLVQMLDVMRQTRGFAIEDESAFEEALSSYATSSDDFPDCLIVARHKAAGVGETFTFDERAAKL